MTRGAPLDRMLGVIAVLAACAAPARGNSSGAGPLAPYERLARSPESARLLALARDAIRDYWRKAESPRSAAEGSSPASAVEVAPDTSASGWPGEPVGVYVTLLDGRATRACVGSPVPTRASLGETIAALAVESLRSDGRRPAVRRDEISKLRVAIAFVDVGDPIDDPMRVDPAREGLLITSASGRVAFLPGEARTVRWALSEARRAGLLRDPREATFRRFHAVTIVEPARQLRDEEISDESD